MTRFGAHTFIWESTWTPDMARRVSEIARATCVWRHIAPGPDVLIRDGLSFLREQAARHGLDGSA